MSVLRNGHIRFRDQVSLSGLCLCLEYIKGGYGAGLGLGNTSAFNLPEVMGIILNLLAYLFVRGSTGG